MSMDINCIGALCMNISTSGAFGVAVLHFVHWQVSQDEIKEQMYAYIFGQ